MYSVGCDERYTVVAPARERGLKYERRIASQASSHGRSREGAWIEINTLSHSLLLSIGRSREGAWIEMNAVID